MDEPTRQARGFVGSDTERSRLRALVAAMEGQFDVLFAPEALRTAWSEMVILLDLGAAPELRQCPDCGQWPMRAATRCGYCWSPLSPLPPGAARAATPPRAELSQSP